MLYHGLKMEYRIYVVIVSTAPLIVYAIPRPVVRLCAEKYDALLDNRDSHICNPLQVKQYLDEMDLPAF